MKLVPQILSLESFHKRENILLFPISGFYSYLLAIGSHGRILFV